MFLLDTHVLIWFFFEKDRIPYTTLQRIIAADMVYVSIASLWEIVIKQSIGKLDIKRTANEIAATCKEENISILDIRPKHLDLIGRLPKIHSDPFDRLIIAQAISEKLTVVSKDQKFRNYNINLLW